MRTLQKHVWFGRRWQKPRKKHKMRGLKTFPKDYRKIFTVKMFDVLFTRRCETQRQKLPGAKAILYIFSTSLFFIPSPPFYLYFSFLHSYTCLHMQILFEDYGTPKKFEYGEYSLYSVHSFLSPILYTGKRRTWTKNGLEGIKKFGLVNYWVFDGYRRYFIHINKMKFMNTNNNVCTLYQNSSQRHIEIWERSVMKLLSKINWFYPSHEEERKLL